MITVGLKRRLFLVPMANDRHGKSTLMCGFLSCGTGRRYKKAKKGPYHLTAPGGQGVDALIFPRSYQEKLRKSGRSLLAILDLEDPLWMHRDLVVLPSHLVIASQPELDEMIAAAHQGGFDAIGASLVIDAGSIGKYSVAWQKPWDERWTIGNASSPKGWKAQVLALSHALWERTCSAMFAW